MAMHSQGSSCSMECFHRLLHPSHEGWFIRYLCTQNLTTLKCTDQPRPACGRGDRMKQPRVFRRILFMAFMAAAITGPAKIRPCCECIFLMYIHSCIEERTLAPKSLHWAPQTDVFSWKAFSCSYKVLVTGLCKKSLSTFLSDSYPSHS